MRLVRLLPILFMAGVLLNGQPDGAAGAANAVSPAAGLRKLLSETPRLPLAEVSLTAHLPNGVALGTVSSVAADAHGVIYVLQRGNQADPVLAVEKDGRVLRSWGKGMFTVPHSIRVAPDGNIWTVDAGSSVLLEFSPQGAKLREIDIGEVASGKDCAFPGLCGTTDVTFAAGGHLYISDGYGNARILEYSASGKRLRVWGSKGTGPGQFQIPHGIATDGKVVYVADRTNARVQRFDLNGRYLGEWKHVGRPFALAFRDNFLWISIMTLEPGGREPANAASPWILKVDPASGRVVAQISAPGPHSVDVNAGGELFAGGCCGGKNPTGFFWLRRGQ